MNRKSENRLLLSVSDSAKPEEVDVVCKKCATLACTATDINTYYRHYVVSHKSFQWKIQRRCYNKPPIPGEMC